MHSHLYSYILGQLYFQIFVGGIEKGQLFSVPIPTDDVLSTSRVSIPVGHWKHAICSCFQLGICHAWLWISCCCPLCEFQVRVLPYYVYPLFNGSAVFILGF